MDGPEMKRITIGCKNWLTVGSPPRRHRQVPVPPAGRIVPPEPPPSPHLRRADHQGREHRRVARLFRATRVPAVAGGAAAGRVAERRARNMGISVVGLAVAALTLLLGMVAVCVVVW